MPYSNLPDEANKIFEKVYNDAIKGGKSKEYAAKVGWTAVKNAGYRRSDSGEWVKEESAVYTPEFSMRITKSVFGKDNVMRLQMVASDTEPDSYEERMSLELFNNFIARRSQPVPAAFADIICEDSWKGGDPYLSVAHYRAGTDKKNAPGMVEESYIDGNYFKSRASLFDNELGREIFKAINTDLYQNSGREDKIRVSIAFLDLKHKHGDLVFERNSKADKCPLCEMGVGDKTYLDGYLVHEAFTRVPANIRTAVEVERMADQILTKKDDARSIVGDLADGLEEKSKVTGGDAVVTRNDTEEVVEMSGVPAVVTDAANKNGTRNPDNSPDAPVEIPEIGFAASNRASTTEPTGLAAPSGVRGDTETDRKNDVEDTTGSNHVAVIPYIGLTTSFEALKSAIEKAQSYDDNEEAMKSVVQPAFNKFAEEVRKACMKPQTTEKSSVSADDMRQIASDVVTQVITDQVLPALTELKSMIANSKQPVTVKTPELNQAPRRQVVLQTRSIADMAPATSNKPQSIRDIAARSTGLKQD